MPATPPIGQAQQRLLNTHLERLQQWTYRTPLLTQITKATVTSGAAGGASDGNALVVVNWQGTDVPAPYLSGYTPTAGHVVAVAKTGSQLLILGRIIGSPV